MIHLKIHVESIHEGVRYPCDKCPYKATTISSLKRHGESIHEGVCYSCHGGVDSPVFLGLIYFVFVVLSYILLLVFIIAVQMWRASFEKLVFENSVLTLNECVTLWFSENCHRSCLKTFSLVLPTHSWCTTAEINWGVEGNFKVLTILANTSNKTLWL